MQNIKFSYAITESTILKLTEDYKGTWQDYKFYFHDSTEKYDAWMVMNEPLKPEYHLVKPGRIVLSTGEPASVQAYNSDYCKQFDYILSSQKLDHPGLIQGPIGLPWFPKKSYQELKELKTLEKPNTIAIVSSNKQDTEGHRKRYKFALALKEHFRDRIELFGRGIKPIGPNDDKWDALAGYRYTIAIENSVEEHYFTEKITDAFLAYTFPFYFGCPNIDEYFPKGAYEILDLDDIEKSIKIIEGVLADEGHYERVLPALRAARELVLEKYNVFAAFKRLSDGGKLGDMNSSEYKLVTVKPMSYFALKPIISVIMHAENAAGSIREAVKSVLSQVYEEFELIVVEDSSTDETLQILQELERSDIRMRVIFNDYTKGKEGALKTAREAARGQHVVEMRSEEVFDSEYLVRQHTKVNESLGTGREVFTKLKRKLNQFLGRD